jgi:hypothetical protein
VKSQRTAEEEQVRQLKIVNAQLNPLGVFIRVGFWLTVLLCTLGVLAWLCLPVSLFR